MSKYYPVALLALFVWCFAWAKVTGDWRVGLAVITSYFFGRIMGYLFPAGMK